MDPACNSTFGVVTSVVMGDKKFSLKILSVISTLCIGLLVDRNVIWP